VKVKVRDEFAALGVELRGFYVENVSPTEETQKAIDERAAMGAIGDMNNYLRFKAARAMGDAAQQSGGEAGGMTGAGIGMGAGMGMGAMMAQILGQSMQQQPQPPAAPAAPQQPSAGAATQTAPVSETPVGPGTVEVAFTALELLVGRQLAIPQEERNKILQKLATMEVEFAKEDTDLMVIKTMRKELAETWPWLTEEIDVLFRQPVIEQEMADAARRFMSS
nr:hypothetical protein [Ardenticatenales bacterium]